MVSNSDARRAAKVTSAPALARATAQAAPIPEEAPVTMAFCPTRLKLGDAGKIISYLFCGVLKLI